MAIIIFLLGLIIGSFLNCVIYRLAPHHFLDSSFTQITTLKSGGGLKGRSFCPSCRHVLAWPDLVPLLSFGFLKGKCRYCQKKISWQYPLVEISTALIFLLIFLFQLPVLGYLMAPFLIVVFVYDLKHCLIPDKVVYPAIAVVLIYNLLRSNLESGRFDLDVFVAAFVAAGFFLAIVLLSRGRCMGVGDIKLAFLMGLILGWPDVLVALFCAFFAGAIIGIGLIFFGKKTFKSAVPFGPFLVLGTFVALFYAEELINWYLSLYV